MNATFLRSAADQLRMHAKSPMSTFMAVAFPCAFAFVIRSNAAEGHRSAELTADLSVGTAGIGMLDAIIVMVVFSLLGEKQWKTLYAALGSPGGLVPVVLGRLGGIVVQSLIALPGTFVVLALFWGIDSGFAWGRWLVGGVLLALATASVVGLLAVAVLRFPYSAGMTNGLTGLLMALSALIVPQSALPGPVRAAAFVLPQSHVMAWVRDGALGDIAAAVLLTVCYAVLVVLLVHRLEAAVRRKSVPLEV
ncbi:hypothetical protein ACM01_24650 [Streptomyces viridochromogenes]|uniref:ABC-2 type transporter domain-containing protein n=1 Tax=Streptomyces viridochromogenes TaxID=1938 RepID=A0A0J7Z9D0_STRVR|nr:ABC transporter permease [Streptomyces viridochromogenes]KMS72067.1 hypothetical protein ACM01_24650 [Streptomyces viridochromogenes]KOG08647.1 hypothetical protein ADK35_41365 [Streptomyces viridochromogenes]KOG08674.1 hypothetical protein ADK36_42275 [Streptomyces viridochromogenes]